MTGRRDRRHTTARHWGLGRAMSEGGVPRDTRRALTLARALGCVVEPLDRTGETILRHPSQHPMRFNGRRKDTPKRVRAWLARVQRA